MHIIVCHCVCALTRFTQAAGKSSVFHFGKENGQKISAHTKLPLDS